MYVWLDALTNYITASGWPTDSKLGDQRNTKHYGQPIYMVGKDILRFHGFISWHFDGRRLTIAKTCVAHGWWTNEGKKFQNHGNVIDPNALIAQYGLDQTRFPHARGAVWQ